MSSQMKTMAASSFIRFTLVFVLGLITILPSGARAQEGLFQTAITVNEMVITNYEIEQRTRLLTLLRAPGDPAEEARKGLIEDRLRQSETQRVGIELTEDQILSGMEEFAARVNLSAEQFITIIERAGVARETFRDFVSAGLAWRGYVQGRFGPRAQVSEAEVDRAVSLQGARGGARVLLAEIILPLAPQVAERNTNLANQLSESLTSEGAFSSAARRYSASPTRGRGGRLEWLPLGNVPPPVRAAVLTLAPGETSEPVNLGQAIALFQLRDLEETEAATPETQALEYATILIPGGRSEKALAEAQKLRDNYDTCDDLYKPAQSLPAEYFDRVVLPAAEVPGDIALELAKLDDNEDSFALTRQGDAFLVYLKLCGRTVALPLNEDGEEIDVRAQTRDRLFNQRLASFASSALAELQAEAIIIEE